MMQIGPNGATAEPDEVSFEDNVLAEERIKSRTLSNLKSARELSCSPEAFVGSIPTDSFMRYAAPHLPIDVGPGAPRPVPRPPQSFLSPAEDDGAPSIREEIDVREELFQIHDAYPHSTDFQRVIITEANDALDEEEIRSCKVLKRCVELREKYIAQHPSPPQDVIPNKELRVVAAPSPIKKNEYRRRQDPEYDVFSRRVPDRLESLEYVMVNGVMKVSDVLGEGMVRPIPGQAPASERFSVPSFSEFVVDFDYLRRMISSGPVKSYSFKRLKLLESKFKLHCLLNDARELEATKSVPHRDFYNVRKVDTHVHHSACMNAKHLLRFIKSKLRNCPQEVVVFRDGQFLTLGEVFKSLKLSAYDLSIDTLDMHANNTFHRFDRFNLKYNPAGQSRLREIFLKTDNVIGGRYLAEITKEVITDLEASKYQLVEWRVSIYGRKASEWDGLARWFYVNKLAHKNVRWLIQVPRLYHTYRTNNDVASFGEFLNNIFAPLFEVTLEPESNLPLHYFLETVVGFDSVDDESRPEFGYLVSPGGAPPPTPDQWTMAENPPFGYWMYYMYANIVILNKLRASRGLPTFEFRPHCGEAGDTDHLVSTFLLAHKINHGILLNKLPALHYLYYLCQIGIAMSPLSNNKLFMDYNKNPFPKYFSEGLNVSLSTDDPLMLHYTKDALVEEYSVATQVWKLTSTDQCEIARNSVLQSGWEKVYKQYFLGKDFCDIRETNVPEIRLRYRKETLDYEISLLNRHM